MEELISDSLNVAQKHKVFIAINLSNIGKDFIQGVSTRIQEMGVIADYEPPSKFHLTLAFLGERSIEDCKNITKALDAIADRMPTFVLPLTTVRKFPHGAVWVGPSRKIDSYNKACGIVSDELKLFGIKVPRTGTPHVTICKLHDKADRIPYLDDLGKHEVCVDSLHLLETVKSPEGLSKYIVRKRVSLVGRGQTLER